MVHGRSSLVESFDWLNQFLCDEREKKKRREGRMKGEREREKIQITVTAATVAKEVRVDCVAQKILDEARVQTSDAGFDGLVDHSVWKSKVYVLGLKN